MPGKTINQFLRQSVLDPKDLLVIAPCIAGSSTTDATANTYGDAKYVFAGDVATVGGAPTTSANIQASENLTAGDLVNIYTLAGAARVRKANATDATKPANGFVAASVLSGSSVAVYFSGQINGGRSGLTPGTTYWLDTTAGSITAAPPSSAGNLVQEVGVAVSATSLAFQPKTGVQL